MCVCACDSPACRARLRDTERGALGAWRGNLGWAQGRSRLGSGVPTQVSAARGIAGWVGSIGLCRSDLPGQGAGACKGQVWAREEWKKWDFL